MKVLFGMRGKLGGSGFDIVIDGFGISGGGYNHDFDQSRDGRKRIVPEIRKVILEQTSSLEIHCDPVEPFFREHSGFLFELACKDENPAKIIFYSAVNIDFVEGVTRNAPTSVDVPQKLEEFENPVYVPENANLLEQLEEALRNLRREITSINDPDRRTSEILQLRAQIDAFASYLDKESLPPPETIPSDVPGNFRNAIRRINVEKVSNHAHKWMNLILKILDKFF